MAEITSTVTLDELKQILILLKQMIAQNMLLLEEIKKQIKAQTG